MKYYGIYDLKNKEQCVFIGNSKEISEFLNIKRNTLYEYIIRKHKPQRRYEIVKIEVD